MNTCTDCNELVRYCACGTTRAERAVFLPAADPRDAEITRLQGQVSAWVAAASQTGLLLPDADGMPRHTAYAVSLQSQVDALRYERDHARATKDKAVQLLVAIHSLLYPPYIKTADGRTMAFRPKSPDPHEVLQELSDRIRALPDELAALDQPAATPSQPTTNGEPTR